MLKGMMSLARPALFALEPEQAHAVTLKALKKGIYPRQNQPDDHRLSVMLLGLEFPNPLGMAAGFDKNGEVHDALLDMGFGFSEIGTVTPLPQAGNPRPRVFRLIDDRALVNRLGFNNDGHRAVLARLQHRREPGNRTGIVGLNIGANKDSREKINDYVLGLGAFFSYADYFTVNVSSPNTPGLRDLQSPDMLKDLLFRLEQERHRLEDKNGQPSPPLLVKLAPDIHPKDLEKIIDVTRRSGVDGLIISNTTLSRRGASNPMYRGQAGGLSGRPLFDRSTAMIGEVFRLTEGQLPLVGVGGIECTKTALAKIEAGASLIQLYSGLVYEGLELIENIKQGLVEAMVHKGLTSLRQTVGREALDWAKKWPTLAQHDSA